MSKYTFTDNTYKCDDYARDFVHTDDNGRLHGCIVTPLGVVSIVGRSRGKSTWQPDGRAVLRAIYNGYEYVRRITPCPSRRGIATIAHRWLKGIVAEVRGGGKTP